MQIYKAMQICLNNNIKISPKGKYMSSSLYLYEILVNGKELNKKIKVKPKQKDGYKDLNEALTNTYIYYAEKIKKQKDE